MTDARNDARGALALFLLAARRTAGPLAVALLVLALFALLAGDAPRGVFAPEATAARDFGGAARAREFGLVVLVLGAALGIALERLLARRAAAEDRVRRAAPIDRRVAAAADLAGYAAAGTLAFGLAACAVEWRGETPLAWREFAAFSNPVQILVREAEGLSIQLPDPGPLPTGTHLSAELFALPGDGFAAAIALGLRRVGVGEEPGPWIRRELRVVERVVAPIEVPAGAGALELALLRRGPGAPVALAEDGLQFEAPTTGRWGAARSLALHGAAAALLFGALASLGARVLWAPFAVGAAASLALAALILRLPIAGAGLFAAQGTLAQGLAPRAPGALEWLPLVVLAGIAAVVAAGRLADPGGRR
ncbi:MAG: hypothetical protein GC161_03015 [Planctomycetaceae bacterium]|nr:hypothetical protein [Planctomycetaceae bacterium]